MNFKVRKREDPIVEIAPLIDVVFLLLLFFMVTTQFISMPGLKISLPSITPGKTITTGAKIELDVDAAGDVFLDGNPVSLDNLGALIKEEAPAPDSAVIVLMADESVPHGRIVTIMDSIRSVGLTRVVLAARWSENHPGR